MFFKRLYLCFTYGPEIEQVLKNERERKCDEEFKRNRHRLQLCEKHNPVNGLTNYASHNCDYCKLLREHKGLENYVHRINGTNLDKSGYREKVKT